MNKNKILFILTLIILAVHEANATRLRYPQNQDYTGVTTPSNRTEGISQRQPLSPDDVNYLTIDPQSTRIQPIQQPRPRRPADINAAAHEFFSLFKTQLEDMSKEVGLSREYKELAQKIINLLTQAGIRQISHSPVSYPH